MSEKANEKIFVRIIYFVDIIFANIIRIIEYLFKILFLIWILINFEKRKISYDCTILIPE
jgi:hypothetical protein